MDVLPASTTHLSRFNLTVMNIACHRTPRKLRQHLLRTICCIVLTQCDAHISRRGQQRIQVIESLAAPRFIYDRHYLSGGRSDRYVLLNIVAGKPRSAEQKWATYWVLNERLQQRLNLDPNDLMIIIQQTQPEDRSFSGGKMLDLGMIV